jgi:nitroreductase
MTKCYGGLLEVFDALRIRKSVRAYELKQIPDEVLMKVLEAGRISPSANNAQPWHFIVIKDFDKRKTLSKRRWTKFLSEAPVVLVGCGDRGRSPDFNVIDVSIALQQMVIAATAEGLGTCWIGDFDGKTVRDLVKIPDKFDVVCMLAMGYPREKLDMAAKIIRARSRKKLDEIVSYEEYGKQK